MLLRNLFLKSLFDNRRALGWWVLGIILLCALMTSFYPSISTNDALQDYIDAFDPDLLAIFGFTEMIDMTSGAGYLSAEMFSLMVPLLLIILGISLGASSIAGEEDKRTIEILLSEPISRRLVFLQKYAFLLAASLLLAAVVWLSLAIGSLAVGMDLSMANLAAATASSFLLGIAFGSLAFAIGAITGKRGLCVGVSAGDRRRHLRHQHPRNHRRLLRTGQMGLSLLLPRRQLPRPERPGPTPRPSAANRNRRPRNRRLLRLPASRPPPLNHPLPLLPPSPVLGEGWGEGKSLLLFLRKQEPTLNPRLTVHHCRPTSPPSSLSPSPPPRMRGPTLQPQPPHLSFRAQPTLIRHSCESRNPRRGGKGVGSSIRSS